LVLLITTAVFPLAGVHAQASSVAMAVPNNSSSVTQRVTVNVDRAPLEEVIALIAREAGLIPMYTMRLLPKGATVTLHVRQYPVDEAFRDALQGTGLSALFRGVGYVSIVHDSAAASTGTIAGRVIDATTKQPLHRATVLLDSASRGAATDENGTFRIAGVSTGVHRVTVKRIGYAKAFRAVTVEDGVTATVDVALDVAATALDQVVVAGTVIPTALKAVPNAMTIITSKEIEQRGITRIEQLFRGDVPGMFAQNLGAGASVDNVIMFSRGTTTFSAYSAGTQYGTNPIKTYVDGVELADAHFLNQIDPKSIERIEILTGPQASTIYGSNAINGVMQIFTKRGASVRPQLTLNLLSGWVENDFSSARTPQHDYSAQLSGVEGRISYNAGGSWNYTGPWTPSKQTTRTGVFEGTRLELPVHGEHVAADMTFRRTATQNRSHGSPSQSTTGLWESGWFEPSLSPGGGSGGGGLGDPSTEVLLGQTLGLTLSYAPTRWWSHELGIGQDASDDELRGTTPGYLSTRDTVVGLSSTHTDRRSLRYTTTAQVPITALTQATVTVGIDGWQSLTSYLDLRSRTLTGTITDVNGSPYMTRQPGHNTGGFLQTQFGVRDQLFLTYGLRAEWNPSFGANADPSYAPRYGIAYTQDVGAVTAKLRASYGRSTRPPPIGAKNARAASFGNAVLADYGNFDYFLANPELTPEHQQGSEGGVELYWGTRGSLVVTRYNQTVDQLIAPPKVDSVRSRTTPITSWAYNFDANGYGYMYQYRYLNIGSIRNQGWEAQGSVTTGPVTTKGTYSWTKSRTIGVNPKYRASFSAEDYPQYQPGATFDFLPEHTWALAVLYSRAQTTVGLNVSGVGRITNLEDDFSLKYLGSGLRLRQNSQRMRRSGYVDVNNGYTMADLTGSHRFSSRVEGVLQVQNLMNYYVNDFLSTYATMGRQEKAGLRIRL